MFKYSEKQALTGINIYAQRFERKGLFLCIILQRFVRQAGLDESQAESHHKDVSVSAFSLPSSSGRLQTLNSPPRDGIEA